MDDELGFYFTAAVPLAPGRVIDNMYKWVVTYPSSSDTAYGVETTSRSLLIRRYRTDLLSTEQCQQSKDIFFKRGYSR